MEGSHLKRTRREAGTVTEQKTLIRDGGKMPIRGGSEGDQEAVYIPRASLRASRGSILPGAILPAIARDGLRSGRNLPSKASGGIGSQKQQMREGGGIRKRLA